MKNSILFLLSWMLTMVAAGQTLTVSTPQLNFGTVTETNPDSLPLTIYNNMGKTVNVTDIIFYSFYGSPAFSASQSAFSIADGSSQLIYVKFSPLHNIYHNSEMVIENDGHRGSVTVDLLGQGHYSKTYYNATENLSEEVLKTSIQTITGQNYNSLGYNDARDSMFMIVDNQRTNGQGATQNTLECVYTGRLAVGYIDRTDCQNPPYDFNTEHTYPQSLFSSAEPMKSDLHHLFPTDNTANNVRANYPFGTVTNATWSVGGSKFDNNTNIFEPRDAHKGETARAMMYFVLRYQNYGNFMDSQESILRTWNKNFPPTNIERVRNDHIMATCQHNKNPFVDYPQFADRIHSFSTTSVAPNTGNIQLFDSIIDYWNVAVGSFYIYSFFVMNASSAPVYIAFTLSTAGQVSFTSGGVCDFLQPGESYKTELNLTAVSPGNLNDILYFNVGSSGCGGPFTNYAVPIIATMSTVSVSEIKNTELLISPNPTSGFINVRCNNNEKDLVFTMSDELGKPIPVEAINNNDHYTIDLHTVADGFYILSAISKNGYIYNQKIIKKEY